MTDRRAVAIATTLTVGALTAVLAGPALAQVPLPSDAPCVPGLTCPSENPSPTTSEAPSPTSPSPTPNQTFEPSPQDTGPTEPTDGFSFDVAPPEPVDTGSGGDDAPLTPDVAPPPTTDAGGGGSPGGVPYAVLVATDAQTAQALTGTAVVLLLAMIVGSVAFGGTYRLTRQGVLEAHHTDGGIDVETTQRWRTWASLGAFAVAGIVAIVGFVRIAGEPLVPIQLVYLASTGLAVVILAAVGGALLVAQQLRADEHRLQEIERSLAVIAGHVAEGVADPPRLLDRGTDDDEDPEDE